MITLTPDLSYGFLLILIRTSAMLVSAPLLSHRAIPAYMRIGFSIFFALIMVPLQKDHLPATPASYGPLAGAVISEVLFGLGLGLAMQMVFVGLQMGSHLIGLQIGFSIGSIYDPVTGAQFSSFDQFYGILATLVFFSVNGHHLVVGALAETLRAVPPGTFNPLVLELSAISSLVAGLTITAVRIAMPVLVALFLTDVGMSFVARTVPQANILVVGFPVKIVVGLVVMAAALPATTALMTTVVEGPLTGSSLQLLGAR
ncbi:MAG: flagellar biosynthetic protein FliR [Dehalococcoidia bacterium]